MTKVYAWGFGLMASLLVLTLFIVILEFFGM